MESMFACLGRLYLVIISFAQTFNCSHDVTIVFFSRTYYEASDINEFPPSMCDCLQKDSKGRYYEDYYRVAIQNERMEDWNPRLIDLKKLFNLYEKEVINYHKQEGIKVPKAYNSTASQGNFLEVLNMSLNGRVMFNLLTLISNSVCVFQCLNDTI